MPPLTCGIEPIFSFSELWNIPHAFSAYRSAAVIKHRPVGLWNIKAICRKLVAKIPLRRGTQVGFWRGRALLGRLRRIGSLIAAPTVVAHEVRAVNAEE